MNLYVERSDDGLIVRDGDPGDVLARRTTINPLRAGLDGVEGPGRSLVWSGTLGDDLFEPHPATWMRPGHEALRSLCAAAAQGLVESGRVICFQPHRRHVLSDPASCVSFLGEFGTGGTFEVALAPGSLLEPAMTLDLDDHLRKAFQTLGRSVSMVILHDLAALIGEGRLSPDLLRSLLREYVDPRTPVVLAQDDLDRQREWLAV